MRKSFPKPMTHVEGKAGKLSARVLDRESDPILKDRDSLNLSFCWRIPFHELLLVNNVSDLNGRERTVQAKKIQRAERFCGKRMCDTLREVVPEVFSGRA